MVIDKSGMITYFEVFNIVGRQKWTISREVSRNTGKRGYRPSQAE